jgi:hypothetical protein
MIGGRTCRDWASCATEERAPEAPECRSNTQRTPTFSCIADSSFALTTEAKDCGEGKIQALLGIFSSFILDVAVLHVKLPLESGHIELAVLTQTSMTLKFDHDNGN